MRAAWVVILALSAGACAQPEPPFPPGSTVDFRVQEPTAFDPAAEQPLRSPVRGPLTPEQQMVLDGISQDPAAFLGSNPPEAVLNEAELVFFAAGRLFELAQWYAEAADGGATHLLPRVAWAFERAGLHTEAARRAEAAVEALPDSASAHFVQGFVLGQEEFASDDLLQRVTQSFERALELDPEFVGPGNVSAAALRGQVRELRAVLDAREQSGRSGHAAPSTGAVDPHAGVPGAPPLRPVEVSP